MKLKQLNDDDLAPLLDPVTFSEVGLDVTPFDYQATILKNMSKRVAVKAGRQSGKTTVTAIKALHFALTHRDTTVIVIAPSMRQSQILFRKLCIFLSQPLLDDSLNRKTQTLIEFKNGSQIVSLPAGDQGVTVRGFSADLLIVDEAAFIPEKVFQAILPMLAATDGSLVLLGTPWGEGGTFYEACQKNSDFDVFTVSSEQCPLISKMFLKEQKSVMLESDFLREYSAVFIPPEDSYFPSNGVLKCCRKKVPKKFENYEKFYLGVDPASFGRDKTIYSIVGKKVDDLSLVCVDFVQDSKKPLTHVAGKVRELNEKYNFAKVVIDSTALGQGLIDILSDLGDLPLVSVKFSVQKKSEMFQNLKKLIEDQDILFPFNKEILRQFGNIKYILDSSGNIKFRPINANVHDDYVDAICLSAWGSRIDNYVMKIVVG